LFNNEDQMTCSNRSQGLETDVDA